VDIKEGNNMGLLDFLIRCDRKLTSSRLLLVGLLTLGTSLGFSSGPDPERIQATYAQNGNPISVTLIIYDFTTPTEMQDLNNAYGAPDPGLNH
jgi:hypothetical protein